MFGSPGRDEMWKPNFTSLEVLAEQVRKAERQIYASQGRAEVRKQNFTYSAVKTERKCGSGTSHLWQLRQNERADAELQVFSSKDRVEAELQICGRAEGALGNIGLNPFLEPSYRAKNSPSARRIGL